MKKPLTSYMKLFFHVSQKELSLCDSSFFHINP